MEQNKSNVFYKSLFKEYKKVDRAEGVYVYDTDGKKYLDFVAGIAVTNIGQGVQEVFDAIQEQCKKATYVYGGTFSSEAREELCSRIISIAPEGMERVFLCGGGSEAIESVAKIARQYQIEKGHPSKYKIIGRWQSYHGNTFATLSFGGRPSWRGPYEEMMPRMPHIAQCNCYRCPYGLKCPECDLACANELERIIKYEGADTVAAFILEPIIGTTATATIPADGYLQRVREICDKYDVLLCCDEVITGLGRTGKWFAVDHWNVKPDLLAIAKGLGGGYVPIGAVMANKKVIDAFAAGSGTLGHSFTFSAMPIVCAGANAVLKYIIDNNLPEKARIAGDILLRKFHEALDDIPAVGEVRGKGLLIGIELVANKETKEPFDPKLNISGKVGNYCFEHGVMISSGVLGVADGVCGEALQISPPLIITEEQMDEGVRVIREAILEATK